MLFLTCLLFTSREHLRNGYYKVRIGSKYLSEEQLKTTPIISLKNNCTVHFTPVIVGSGKNGAGIFQIVAGIVIIAASIISYQYYGVGYGTALMFGMSGATMALGGAIKMCIRDRYLNNIEKAANNINSTTKWSFRLDKMCIRDRRVNSFNICHTQKVSGHQNDKISHLNRGNSSLWQILSGGCVKVTICVVTVKFMLKYPAKTVNQLFLQVSACICSAWIMSLVRKSIQVQPRKNKRGKYSVLLD